MSHSDPSVSDPSVRAPAQLRALIAEDEVLISWQLQDILEGLGVAASVIVATGEEAVESIAEVDLVFLDVNLASAMSGIEAAALIRCRSEVPIVFITAYAGEGMINRQVDMISRSVVVGKPATQSAITHALDKLGIDIG